MGPFTPRPRTRVLLVVAGTLLVALAVRLPLALDAPAGRIGGDPGVYDEIAVSIAGGHGWPRLGAHLRVDPHGEPTALHPPAWPYALGAAYALTGHGGPLDQRAASAPGPNTPHHRAALAAAASRWTAGRVLNATLGSVAAGLLALIALDLWGLPVAAITGVVAALYPAAAVLGVALLSEPLFVALELGAVLAVLRYRRSGHRTWIVAAGVLTGLAVLTRANGAALLLPLGVGAWTARPRWSARALVAPVSLIVVAALTVLPWTVRNLVVLHAPVPVSTDLGQTVAGTYNPVAAGDRFRWRSQGRLPRSYGPARAEPTEPARSSALTRLGLAYLRAHPLDVLKASAWNTARLLELDPYGRRNLAGELRSRRLEQVSVLGFLVIAVLALAGAVTRRARRIPAFVWSVPLVLWATTVPLATNFSRFRAPIDPFLVLLAALALAGAVNARSPWSGRSDQKGFPCRTCRPS